MRLHRIVPILVAAACVSEPSYEGRLCDESTGCPEGLNCHEGRCRLLVPPVDAGGARDAGELEDADVTEDGGPSPVDAGNSGRDAEVGRDAAPKEDASVPDAGEVEDATPPDTGDSLCMTGETRACYTGPSGTRGVGICSDGISTCDGDQFGPCEDDVLPAVEVCNGLDDDCDRVVDDGCPSGATSFVQPFDTPLTGWLPFGDTWELEGCGPGEVVVGFFGHYDEYLNEVGEHCDTPVVVTDTGVSPHAHSLVLMPAPSAAPRGGAMGTQYNAACPAGMAVVGISGLSGSWIDQLSFTCAELELVNLTPANPVPSYVVREVAGTRTLVALQAGGTGGAPFDLPCPTDSVAAVRLRGALGSTTCCPSLVTTLGLACRELEVSIR